MNIVRLGGEYREVAIVPEFICAVRRGGGSGYATVEVRPVMGDWIEVWRQHARTFPSTPRDDPSYAAQDRVYEEIVTLIETATP